MKATYVAKIVSDRLPLRLTVNARISQRRRSRPCGSVTWRFERLIQFIRGMSGEDSQVSVVIELEHLWRLVAAEPTTLASLGVDLDLHLNYPLLCSPTSSFLEQLEQ